VASRTSASGYTLDAPELLSVDIALWCSYCSTCLSFNIDHQIDHAALASLVACDASASLDAFDASALQLCGAAEGLGWSWHPALRCGGRLQLA
jgi:hypothetical protein